MDYWSKLTQLPIAKLKEDVEHKIQFRPHVPDFLASLKAAGKRSVIVTNAHRDSVNIKIRKTGLDQLVDRIISSHDYQEPKESQAFWQHLQREEPFDLERTVLIDDSLAVLESARRFGLAHLLCVYEPDSQKPKRPDTELKGFKAVDEFNQIMPDGPHKPTPSGNE